MKPGIVRFHIIVSILLAPGYFLNCFPIRTPDFTLPSVFYLCLKKRSFLHLGSFGLIAERIGLVINLGMLKFQTWHDNSVLCGTIHKV